MSDVPEGEVVIRDMTRSDLMAVMAIEQTSFSMPWRETTFESLLQRSDADLIAAVADGRLVGYAVCWTIVEQAELGNVAVDAEWRNRGVGLKLVQAALERVRRRSAEECFLEVRESNRTAQSLYQKCGFRSIGRRRRYYSNPTEDALVMRARL
ncbi:MAG: ribosomal protein S18-alanine N-acetyltransferase [Gemmatimonadetes bacterium]|nr:ribosomal protein S18-alanine N-acetyltransferase [Gemmatimonadota bacterium]